MKTAWWKCKASRLQQFADTNNTRAFYNSLKEVWGISAKHTAQIKTKDANTLTEEKDILIRWAEHFNDLLNETTVVSTEVIGRVKNLPTAYHLNTAPDILEVENAITALADNKKPGNDQIPGELLKYGGTYLKETLWEVISKV